jgi:drug/metabolite transporter (DMT)-like permease
VIQFLLLLFGVYACSTAVILIKMSGVPAVPLSGYRLVVAAVALSPLFFRDLRRYRGRFGKADLKATVLPGIALGLHFITWIIGARQTPAANSSLIVNMVPIAMPFFLAVMVGERLTPGERLGTVLSIAGVVLLGAWDLQLAQGHFTGDAMCLLSMVLFCYYLALARKNKHIVSLWLYLVPLYLIGGVLCLLADLVVRGPALPLGLREWLLIVGLGLVPTVMGHSILNYAMKHMRGQIVSIVNLFQFVFAGIMAYWLFDEVPAWAFYPAGGLIAMGVYVACLPGRTQSIG